MATEVFFDQPELLRELKPDLYGCSPTTSARIRPPAEAGRRRSEGAIPSRPLLIVHIVELVA